jgi:3-oxoacyl-[acyl-carrier-protein] synthase II
MAGGKTPLSEVWIVDGGAVTSAGNSLEATWHKIMSGKTAIGEIDRFPVEAYRAKVAATIPDIKPEGPGSMVSAIVDRLLRQIERVPADSLIITASTKAGIDNLEKMVRGLAFDPGDILPPSIGERVATKLGLRGGSISISAACASSTIAVAQGAAMITSGSLECVLICCADAVTEFLFSGFSALQALSPTPCKPFDRDRAGLTPGEGAAFLLLMSSTRARREGYSPMCIVKGFGIANDAFHITAPDTKGSGLLRAASNAIAAAGIKKRDIAGISAHGTGTIQNDFMELTAFRTLFGRDCPPLYSVKGCIGHTFGAAGGIEVALGIRTLLEQTIPPTVGFVNPEQGAEGLVSSNSVSMAGSYLLTSNSGFGGINAAIILERGESC